MDPWWTSAGASLVGGLGGGAVGLLGGLLGTLMGTLGPKGKARGFVLGLHLALVVFGALVLAAGIVAVVGGQPYGVYFPLLMLGGIMACVFGGLLPVTRGVYQQAEGRRLESRVRAAR